MFKFTETVGSFIKKFKQAFQSVFRQKFKNKNILIKEKVKRVIRAALFGAPEVHSLLFGKLRLDFGLTNEVANQVVFEIIEKITNNIAIEAIYDTNNLVDISFKFNALSVQQLLMIRNASYFSVNSAGEQSKVPWLEWLLLRGTQVVVPGFAVAYGNYSKGYQSRTKEAIMVSLDNPNSSRNSTNEPFRVDPEFAGTENDNFITRAIIPLQPLILKIIKEEIEK